MAPSKKSSNKNKKKTKPEDEILHKPTRNRSKPKSSKSERNKKKDFCANMCGRILLNVLENNSKENIVVSPLSFHAILNMIASGATGRSLEQLISFLGCNNVDDVKSKFSEMMDIACNNNDGDGPVVSLVNGVWVDKNFPLIDSYVKFVRRFCKAEARNFDFVTQANEIVEETNLWAKNETKGLVTDVLRKTYINSDTICLLGNALYFKGAWKRNFKKNRTKKMDFYLLNGEKVSASFMTGCPEYLYESFNGFQVVKIPYRMGAEAMYILLPDEKDGLGTLLQKVDSDPGFFSQNFKLQNKRVDIFWIPKFKFSYMTDEGRETMINLGLTLPFSEDCQELTEIVDISSKIPFHISKVVQKASIEVDEERTETAVVTFAMEEGCCMNVKRTITKFVADHPFLFLIREEKSRMVLFSGTILNPCLG